MAVRDIYLPVKIPKKKKRERWGRGMTDPKQPYSRNKDHIADQNL